jgi:hypothetical protein
MTLNIISRLRITTRKRLGYLRMARINPENYHGIALNLVFAIVITFLFAGLTRQAKQTRSSAFQ